MRTIIENIREFKVDVISIILVNLFTIYGVIFLGWSLFAVLFLYWFEGLIIGFFNVFKMAIAKAFIDDLNLKGYTSLQVAFWKIFLKVILIPFFMLHYGMFMLGHFMFIYFISFAPYIFEHGGSMPPVSGVSSDIFISIALIFLSHGFSFIYNFILKKEYNRKSTMEYMSEPYMRVILMHLVIILGFGLIIITTMAIQTQKISIDLKPILSSIAVSVFIILKIKFDISAHNKEHKIK